MIPQSGRPRRAATWSAARPLIGERGASTGRELSRTFKCFDHAAKRASEGFVTISGGKRRRSVRWPRRPPPSSARSSASESPCRTREYPLLPHTAYYA